MTILVPIDFDIESVPFEVEHDPDTGHVMVSNDEIRVAVMGEDMAEAITNFRAAVGTLVVNESSSGRGLPEALARYVHAPAYG